MSESAERRALAALWSLRGIGRGTLDALIARGPLEQWLDAPPANFIPLVDQWVPQALRSLAAIRCLREVADQLDEKLHRFGYEMIFEDHPKFPPRLTELRACPPLLFVVGPGAAVTPRRRIAMVGTRKPDAGFLTHARELTSALGASGVGIISGGAVGVDQACHGAAMRAGAETWAFLGSALDQIDAAQRDLIAPFRDHGGTLFSELPPGTRANKSTFPRRNRLISGAADVVVVLRAGDRSGALYTGLYAREQGRPVLAMPGDPFNEAAVGCNALLAAGAGLCLTHQDVLRAAGVSAGDALLSGCVDSELAPVSALAQQVLAHLSRTAIDFDVLLGMTQCGSGDLASALLELELANRVVKKPGRRYETR